MKKFIAIFALLLLTGCATLQAEFQGATPLATLDAIGTAVDTFCGAVPKAASVEAVLASMGIANPTASQITNIAQQICSVLVPPKPVAGMSRNEFAMAAGSPSAPVIMGYLNGVPIYGYWTK